MLTKNITLLSFLFSLGREQTNIDLLKQTPQEKSSSDFSKQNTVTDILYSQDFSSSTIFFSPFFFVVSLFFFLIFFLLSENAKIKKETFYIIFLVLIFLNIFVFVLDFYRSFDHKQNKKKLIKFCQSFENQITPTKKKLSNIKEEENINFEKIFQDYDSNSLILLLPESNNLIVFDRCFDTVHVINQESFHPDDKIYLTYTEDIPHTIALLFEAKLEELDYKEKFNLLIQQIKKDFPQKVVITGEEFLEYYTEIILCVSRSMGVSIFRKFKNKDLKKLSFSTNFLRFLESFLDIFNENIAFREDTFYKYSISEDLRLSFQKFEITEKDSLVTDYSIIRENTLKKLIKGMEKNDLVAIRKNLIVKFNKFDTYSDPVLFHCFQREKQQRNLINNLSAINLWGKSGSIEIFSLMKKCLLTEAQSFIKPRELVIRPVRDGEVFATA